MIKKIVFLTCALFLGQQTAIAAPVSFVDGKQYISVSDAKATDHEVVEVFSFYCGACFNLYRSGGVEYLKDHLPKNVTFSRYLLNVSSPIAEPLKTGWAMANVLNLEDEFTSKVFNGIFITRSLNTENDLIKVFNELNISAEKYEAMKKDPLVLAFIEKEANAIRNLRPQFTPAIYVNQKYLINSQILGGDVKEYLPTMNYLLSLPADKN